MLNINLMNFFQTDQVTKLLDKSFLVFHKEFFKVFHQNNLDDALMIANHAAAEFGPIGFWLRHLVTKQILINNMDNGEAARQDGLNLVAELLSIQELCEKDVRVKLEFVHYFPQVNLNKSIIDTFELTGEKTRQADAKEIAKSIVQLFVQAIPKSDDASYTQLTEKILPSIRQVWALARDAKQNSSSEEEIINITESSIKVEGTLFKRTNNPTRLIIHCRGNAENYLTMLSRFRKDVKDFNVSIFAFNYADIQTKGNARLNTQTVVEAICALCEVLQKKLNIPFANIILHGFSIGGAFSALAAKKLHEMNEPVRIVNINSFASLWQISQLESGFMAKQNQLLQNNPEWLMEPGAAFLQIPESHRLLICVDQDPVVPRECSMLDYICFHISEQAEAIKQQSLYHSSMPPLTQECTAANAATK